MIKCKWCGRWLLDGIGDECDFCYKFKHSIRQNPILTVSILFEEHMDIIEKIVRKGIDEINGG